MIETLTQMYDEYAKDKRRISCCMYGITAAMLGGIFLFAPTNSLLVKSFGVLFMTEGVGDFVNGQHHVLSLKCYDGLSKLINSIK